MCGLTGFWQPINFSADAACVVAKKMAESIAHRGPDDMGVWVDEAAGIALAHRRLSILDLSPAGHQPMVSASGRYVIAFNGEIYNHLDLRRELEQIPPSPPLTKWGEVIPLWRGHSDTETLLAGFEAWGIEATLKRTVGMFAIALWDRAERRLTLARDRIGEKPLFYGWVHEAFVFGSELKAWRAYPGFDNPVSRDALALYLQHCAVPAPYSIYQDIFKVEPGCVLSLSAAGLAGKTVQIEPYWRFTDAVRLGLAAPIQSESEAVAALDDDAWRVRAAIERTLRERDTPLSSTFA